MAKAVAENELLKAISLKIKQLRKDKGYKSYETFALDNDLDRKQYWRIEKGANITIKSLQRILDIHGLTFKKFFSDIKF
jgi:transcriptional regulator with XRE-family HTH domain